MNTILDEINSTTTASTAATELHAERTWATTGNVYEVDMGTVITPIR
jgi:hypothetical protein